MKKTRASQRCPKCGGNLFLTGDFYGWYEQCLQCSYTIYLDTVYEKSPQKDTRRPLEVR